MFIKTSTTKKNGRAYHHYQIVESFRDHSQVVRHRVIANLGSLSEKSINSLMRGLNRIKETPISLEAAQLESKRIFEYGRVHVLRSLWHRLNISEIIKTHLRKRKIAFDVASYALLMAVHRVINPSSKLQLTETFKRMDFPEIQDLDYRKILRSLVYLYEHKDAIEKDLFEEQKNLFNLNVDLIFYDITSTYFEGAGPEFAAHGYSRDKRRDRPQILIALAVTQEGLPIGHETYSGNVNDKTTVKAIIDKLKERFRINKCIFVADRGMVSEENIKYLKKHGYEYIFALKKRRLNESRDQFEGDLSKYQKLYTYDFDGNEKVLLYLERRSKEEPSIRYVICHNPKVCLDDQDRVDRRLEKIKTRLKSIEDNYKTASTRLKYASKISSIGRFFKFGIKDEQFFYQADEESIAFEKLICGKFILKTDNQDLSAKKIIASYKTLSMVENAFKNLKDFMDIQPHYHREDIHVKGHVFVCVLAYLLRRLLEKYISRPGKPMISATRILDNLSEVKLIENQLDNLTIGTVTTPSREVKEILKRLQLPSFAKTAPILEKTVKLPAVTIRKLKRYDICSK